MFPFRANRVAPRGVRPPAWSGPGVDADYSMQLPRHVLLGTLFCGAPGTGVRTRSLSSSRAHLAFGNRLWHVRDRRATLPAVGCGVGSPGHGCEIPLAFSGTVGIGRAMGCFPVAAGKEDRRRSGAGLCGGLGLLAFLPAHLSAERLQRLGTGYFAEAVLSRGVKGRLSLILPCTKSPVAPVMQTLSLVLVRDLGQIATAAPWVRPVPCALRSTQVLGSVNFFCAGGVLPATPPLRVQRLPRRFCATNRRAQIGEPEFRADRSLRSVPRLVGACLNFSPASHTFTACPRTPPFQAYWDQDASTAPDDTIP